MNQESSLNPAILNTSPIVFFGTGTVSLASLEFLSQHFAVEAVITKPDGVGVNNKPIEPPVKIWAQDHNISVHQPAGKAALTELFESNPFKSQVGLVVDYGLIIPQPVIDYFPLGIVNSHFSLLPKLRGADPITFAILEGQEVTGVSLMLIVAAMDEGQLIAQCQFKLLPDINIQQLTASLVELSNQLLLETLPDYLSGKIKPWPQDATIAPSYTKKLTKADGVIDWTKPATQLEREVRAYLGWPGSQTQIAGLDVQITAAHVTAGQGQPGQAFKTITKDLAFYTGDGTLTIDRLKPASKRDMTAREFLAGHPLETRL